MRNLKKFLALMLAMIMAMSLMVTANATSTAEDFADGAGITPEFAEAVDVLSGMKVFSGDNGNFKPASNITRAEMAAVLYRLVSGDVDDSKEGLYANYAPFKDVTSDKWYAGYVGYCWNAGLIKGRDPANTVFDPTGNVTGYEALAMLLRAVGYDKNGEFTGSTWQVNVASLSRDLGVLTDVNTTQYGGTLHSAARRDVIASLVFRTAAYVPTVTWSAAMGYNKYIGVPITGGNDLVLNPTLGWKAFGLTRETGIVVGNQDTGETVTRMSIALNRNNADNMYTQYSEVYAYGLVKADYTSAPVNGADEDASINWIATFDAETGLDLFAHKTEIWFDGRQTGLNSATFGNPGNALDWRNTKNSNNLHTYAYFDRSTHTNVVQLGVATEAGNIDVDAGAFAGKGFTVPSRVVYNEYFERFLPLADANGDDVNWNTVDTIVTPAAHRTDPANTKDDNFGNLYLLISNSADKTLDVVIALNIQVSEVTGVDNVNAVKTVTVLQEINSDPEFIDVAGNTLGTIAENATIEQGQLVPGSTTELGRYEIGVHIDGTSDSNTASLPGSAVISAENGRNGTADNAINGGEALGYKPSYKKNNGTGATLVENAWFKLVPVTNTKEGTVVSYNAANGKVNLSDGTTLERSILYNNVVENTIPQVTGDDLYQHANYRFYLTPDGKYLGAELVYGNSFIYGTYLDYEQKTSSSTFNYFLTGVTLTGEITTIPVATYNGGSILGTNNLFVPFRDTYGASTGFVNGLGEGVYRGFAIGGTKADWSFSALGNIGVIAGDNVTGNGWDNDLDHVGGVYGPIYNSDAPEVVFDGTDGTGDVDDPIVINNTAVSLGAAYAGTVDIDGTNVTAAGNEMDKLYFTEATKFILVSGYGTDSVKAEVYNGITELKGSSTTVTIDMTKAVDNKATPDQTNPVALPNVKEGTLMSDMTYLTQSPFVHAQNRVLSRQADVIILPAAAVSRTTTTDLRYVGNSASTLIDAGNDATQFTMYANGVAESIWVEGMTDGTLDGSNSAEIVLGNSHDHFYELTATGDTAVDGKPIYRVSNPVHLAWTQNVYLASTMNKETGTFVNTLDDTSTSHVQGRQDLLRVDKANITNLNALNPAPRWPGINSLTTLNYAGSLGEYTMNGGTPGQHAGEQTVYVSVLYSGVEATQIYVCYDQANAGATP